MSNPRNRWEFYRDAAGLWRWRCKDVNGEVLFISAEGYARIEAARTCAMRAGWTSSMQTLTIEH